MEAGSCTLDPDTDPSAAHSVLVRTPSPDPKDPERETLITGVVTSSLWSSADASILLTPPLSRNPGSPCSVLVLLVLLLVLGLYPRCCCVCPSRWLVAELVVLSRTLQLPRLLLKPVKPPWPYGPMWREGNAGASGGGTGRGSGVQTI